MLTRLRRKLLTISHSYGVALNRRLAHELARVSGDAWDVTAVAPNFFHGPRDLRPVPLEKMQCEPCSLVPIQAYWTNRIHFFLYDVRLRSILAQKWDFVHCWEEPYIFAGSQIAWWTSKNTPFVFATFQNLNKKYPPPFNWLERMAMQRADGWIAFSQTVHMNLHKRSGYCDRPCRTIYVGVDTDCFYPNQDARKTVRSELGWPDDGPPVIGYLGRFLPEKGLSLLMKTLESIEAPWRAMFVGAGPLEKDLRQWAKKQGDRVRVCSNVKHNAVPAHLNAMDVLCAPSQTTPHWREQLGRMLIEGFACGLPVVGSDSGEIPYVLGDAGIVVGEQDEAGWKNTLCGLLQSPSKRAELGQLGLQRAHDTFAWPIVARQHLNFFSELCDSKATSSS